MHVLETLPALNVLSYRVPPLALPLTVAAAAAALAVFAVRRDALGRRIGTASAVFWVLFVAVLTLSPQVPLSWQVRRGPEVTCELAPGFEGSASFFATGDDWLNVLLYVPLGLIVALLAPRDRRRGWYVALLAAPVVVETLQGLAASFYRTCQTKDVLTNWSGAVLGAAVTLAVRATARAVRRRHDRVDRRASARAGRS